MAAVFAAIALLILALWMWETGNRGVMSLQLLVRVLAIGAALRGWRMAMVLLFAVGFIPIGLYFLGAPSYVASAGIADLLYLATAITLIVRSTRAR
jgi:hypothetical protein